MKTFTSLTVFLGRAAWTNKQDSESAVIEYTANSEGFTRKSFKPNGLNFSKIEVETPRP
jgi:hypothetical protein